MAEMGGRNNSWSYSFCETCLKNSHKKIKMERQMIFAADAATENLAEEMWCCPVCGSTKRL